MVSFVILLVARTARIACADRQTDRQNDKPSTVTLAEHARRGLIILYSIAEDVELCLWLCFCIIKMYYGISTDAIVRLYRLKMLHAA